MASRPGICSISLGRAAAGHSLRHRLDMAQFHGFKGIELFYEDLVSVAEAAHRRVTIGRRPDCAPRTMRAFVPSTFEELSAAHAIRQMCTERGLSVICLQPFWQYEGLLDRSDHYEQLTSKLPVWLRLAEALGTDLIQVPSNFLPADQLSSDPAVAISDLRKLAEAGLAFGGLDFKGDPLPRTTTYRHMLSEHKTIRFAYEALAWGTRCDTWEQAWETVKAVDRPNFGLLLDTFNLAGSRVFADPASASPLGLVPDAHSNLRKSLDRLVSEVDVNKVFYIQVASAEKLAEPLIEGHELYIADQPARMSWSRSCRLFYGEEGKFAGIGHANTTDQEKTISFAPSTSSNGNACNASTIDNNNNNNNNSDSKTHTANTNHGNEDNDTTTLAAEPYLPVSSIAHAIFVDLGFRGWVSHEVFNRRAWDKDRDVPAELAGRAAYSWAKLCTEFQLHAPPQRSVQDSPGQDKAADDVPAAAEASALAPARRNHQPLDVNSSDIVDAADGQEEGENGRMAFL